MCRLLQIDLVSTIGESVALGAAGIIFWGDADYASNKVGTVSNHEGTTSDLYQHVVHFIVLFCLAVCVGYVHI